MNNNSDTLCPNESQGKEIGAIASPGREHLPSLVRLKQILKMDCPTSTTPRKEFFWNIVSQEEFEAD
jgi:hypothetical protein